MTAEELACNVKGVSYKTFLRLPKDHEDRISTQRIADALKQYRQQTLREVYRRVLRFTSTDDARSEILAMMEKQDG